MKNPLDILDEVQRAEASPFLWTRIRQRIEKVREEQVTPAFAWSVSISFLLVVALNVAVILSNTQTSKDKEVATAMHLLPNNSLYR